MGDNETVHQNRIRILRVEKIGVEASVIVVNYGQTCARRVGSDDCRHDRYRNLLIVCHCLCRINCGTATDTANNINMIFLYNFPHLFDFPGTAHSAEDLISSVIVASFKALLHLFMTRFMPAVGANEEPTLS